MELAHALVVDAKKVRVIIVGTRKGSCKDEKAAWRFLEDRLVGVLGTACYDEWIREGENSTGPVYLGIENKEALSDPEGSGRNELERVVKRIAESIVEEREEVPAKWMGLIEGMESVKNKVFFTREEVEEIADESPGFDGPKEQKCEDAMKALRYFGDTGRLVLSEEERGEYSVFMNPEKLVDFVRMVTGPERTIKKRLTQSDAQCLNKGLLSRDGLKILWHKYSAEEREVVLELLCRFDFLMRIPTESKNSVQGHKAIAIPALLPSTANGVGWAKGANESVLVVRTKFLDVFPLGMMGIVIAHLHRTVGGQRTAADFVKSVAILLSMDGSRDGEDGKAMVEFEKKQREIVWTVIARKVMLLAHMRSCLKAFEECLESPLRQIRTRRKHYLTLDCKQEPSRCGREVSVMFELEHEWIMSERTTQLSNLKGQCSCGSRDHLSNFEFITCQPGVGLDIRKLPRAPDDVVVFISHAGEQKDIVAHPLEQTLDQAGFRNFLDVKGLHAWSKTIGEQLSAALRFCNVAIFVLSPEFAAKKWPMRELREMLKLKRKAREEGNPEPTLFPLFFALTVEECKSEALLFERHGEVFEKEGFFEASGQETCSKQEMIAALREVAAYPGQIYRPGEGKNVQEFVQQAVLKVSKSCRLGLLNEGGSQQ